MVRTSGIREKFKSKALKDLARGVKRQKTDEDSEEEEDEDLKSEIKQPKLKSESNSLLSILPKPKHSSFGPTVKLGELLKLPERPKEASQNSVPVERLTDDGMIEVDVGKVVDGTFVKDLTVEKSKPVTLPKGKEKQKNQITYLAQLSKATELERKEQAAQSRVNKAAARSKYGW